MVITLIYLMTNITFSIDKELHKKMKSHPEIKWTEILRRAIVDFLNKMEEPDQISVEELRNQLDAETLHKIDTLDPAKEIEFYEKSKKLESARMKHLLELERSSEK
jgi:hypothetical protein